MLLPPLSRALEPNSNGRYIAGLESRCPRGDVRPQEAVRESGLAGVEPVEEPGPQSQIRNSRVIKVSAGAVRKLCLPLQLQDSKQVMVSEPRRGVGLSHFTGESAAKAQLAGAVGPVTIVQNEGP
jgi:hypothetical protein